MNRRWRLVAHSAGLCFALLSGCGSYDPPPPAAGGQAGASSAGQAGTAGAGSGAGGQASGGAGQAGTAGASGSGGAQASCNNVVPCGGDVVGTWTATSSCLAVSGELDPTVLNLACTPMVTGGTLQVTGTFTANTDGTYTDNTTTTGTETLSVAQACLFLSGTTFVCAAMAAPLQIYGYSMVTCVDAAGGGCTCTAMVNQSGGMAVVSTDASPSGTYTSSNNTLTTTSGQDMTQYPYCVAASTLNVSVQGAGKTGTVTGTVLLQKQ